MDKSRTEEKQLLKTNHFTTSMNMKMELSNQLSVKLFTDSISILQTSYSLINFKILKNLNVQNNRSKNSLKLVELQFLYL